MNCVRCNKPMALDTAIRNAQTYGSNLFACPHCGQAYQVYREMKVNVEPCNTNLKEDDWGTPIKK